MAAEPRTIEVQPGSELDWLLDEAKGTPLRLVRNGERFRLDREQAADDPLAARVPAVAGASTAASATGGTATAATSDAPPATDQDDRRPSPEQVARSIAGIRQAAGSWVGLVDAEEFKANILERRKSSRRPSVR